MKRTLIVLCAAFTFGFVGYVGAQSDQYGGGQSTASKSSSHSSKSSRDVTLTGCLEQGPDSNTYILRNATESNESGSSSMGTSGTSNPTGSSSSTGTSGSSSSSGMSGENQSSSGQSSMSASGSMDFQLVGKNLKKYVGQRVQVRGKVEPMTEGGSSMSGTGSTSGTEGTTGGSTTGSSQTGSSSGTGSMSGTQSGSMGTSAAGNITHRVKVNSVKQLGSSCQ